MSGMNNGMSLAGNGGDYTPAGGSALAGGLTAAELEAHLAATLGGLHTGGIEAPEHSAQEQKASSSVEQSHADSAAAPSAWGASPPPGMGGMQQQQMQWQQQAQAAAAAAANFAPQIRAAQRHVSGLEAQLSQLRAQGGAATEHLNRLKSAQSKSAAKEAGPGTAPKDDKAAKAAAAAEENLAALSKAHAAAHAEWQQAAGALAGMTQQYQHAAAVARQAGLVVPSLVTPPTAVGSLAGVVAYGQSPWSDVQPRKRTGKHMTASDVGYVNRCLGGGLRKTGVDSSRAEWYAHALRAKRIQLSASSRGDPAPTTAALFPPSAIPSATAAQEAFVAGAGRLTHAVQSRAWEERNHVLGRVDKSTVARPRRMLALGDAGDINKSRGMPLLQHLAVQREAAVKAALERKEAAKVEAAKAAQAQAAEVGGVEDATEGGSPDASVPTDKKSGAKNGKKGGKRGAKGGKGGADSDKAILAEAEKLARQQGAAALASALVGQSGGVNPLGAAKVEGTDLWNARQMVDSVAAARVAYLDAALTFQAVQSAGDKASPLALRATQAAVEGAQLALGTALGLCAEGAWPKEGDSAPAPPGDGSVVLGALVGLTKGKKALLRAAQYVPGPALLALVTAAMEHLPMFVASMSMDPDAPVVDDQVAMLLDRCIRSASVPAKGVDGGPPHPVGSAAATLQLMCHWMQALLEHNGSDTVAALFDLPNGGQVLAALLECGEGLAGAQLQEGLPAEVADAVGAAVQRWHSLTDAMNASVMEAHGMAA